MWTDTRGNWHLLQHAFDLSNTKGCLSSTVSAHAFSKNGKVWHTVQPYVAPYGHSFERQDGSSMRFSTCERPKIFIDDSGNLTHVVFAVDAQTSDQGCNTRRGTACQPNGIAPEGCQCVNCKWHDRGDTVIVKLDSSGFLEPLSTRRLHIKTDDRGAGSCGSQAVRQHLQSLRTLHGDGLLTDTVLADAQADAIRQCSVRSGSWTSAAAGTAAPTTIVVSTDMPVNHTMTIHANTLLRFEMGGRLVLGPHVNVTIDGIVDAPPMQIFVVPDPSSRVLFTNGLSGPVLPQWWGAVAHPSSSDGRADPATVDCTRAIQQALDAAAPASSADYNLRAPVFLSHGVYPVSVAARAGLSLSAHLHFSQRNVLKVTYDHTSR
jgi:hypothetical protein